MQTNSGHQQFYPGHRASRGDTCPRCASRRHATCHAFTGLITLLNPAQYCLLLTDPRQRLSLPVKLCGCLADAGFQSALIRRQRAGVYPGLRELRALALYRLPEPVIFELQVGGGFLCRLHCAHLRVSGVFGVFKLDGQRCGFIFRFFKRLTGHGKLCARFPESVNSGRLRIQIAQAVLRSADIASKGFAGSLDRLKRSACPVYCVKQYLNPDVIAHGGFRFAEAPCRAM